MSAVRWALAATGIVFEATGAATVADKAHALAPKSAKQSVAATVVLVCANVLRMVDVKVKGLGRQFSIGRCRAPGSMYCINTVY
jgi:hypothetical protein